jgi:hypothetical protein
MADRIDNIEVRLSRVEEKVHGIVVSIADLSVSMARGFSGVDVAIDEQRKYTEFAFSRLESKVDAGFARVDANFGRVDAHFGRVDAHFERVDAHFERVDAHFARVDANFARLERKLDQFIDTQSETNRLVDRRLRALES